MLSGKHTSNDMLLVIPRSVVTARFVHYSISNGKVTRQFSASSNMAGIVSQRAVVTGSMPFWSNSEEEKGAEIAYCGRVPVRCAGPVAEGDVLVASRCSDGLAVVSTYSTPGVGDLNCSLLQEKGELAVGVAMSELGAGVVGSVEVVVTPQSMAAAKRPGSSKGWCSTFGLVVSVLIVLIGLAVATVAVYMALHVVHTTQEHGVEHQSTVTHLVCEDDDAVGMPAMCKEWVKNGECVGDRREVVLVHCRASCHACAR